VCPQSSYIYILGAGASKPDGVPVTKEIFSAAFHGASGPRNDGLSYRLSNQTWPKEQILELQPVFKLFDSWNTTHLEQDLLDLYENKPTPREFIVDTQRFEDFYSRLYYMSKGRKYNGCELTEDQIRNIWQKAKHLFYHTVGSAGWHRDRRHYQAFVEKALTRPGAHCVISFNIDSLLDDLLYDRCKSFDPRKGDYDRREELAWSYGIVFEQTSWPQYYEFFDEAKISYYKLHGSLNWRFDQGSQRTSLCHPQNPCDCESFRGGGAKDDLLVIPPVEEKDFPLPLRTVWKKASDKLSKAEELCVIGYSAPDVDREAVALLRRTPSSLKRVVIVNPSEDHTQRILGLLGNPSGEIVTRYVGFKEYLEKELGGEVLGHNTQTKVKKERIHRIQQRRS